MGKKSINYTRIYIWHRFEQAEADCVLNNIITMDLKYKKISLSLMRKLACIGKFTGVLPPEDVKSMGKIIAETSKIVNKKTVNS